MFPTTAVVGGSDMKKIGAALVAAMALTGCMYSLDGWEARAAVTFCESRGGVDYLLADMVVCNSGEMASYKSIAKAVLEARRSSSRREE